MAEMQPLKVGAIVFYVKDLNRSEAFYRDTMGMKTTMRQGQYNEDHPEEGMLFVEAGEVTMIFFQRDERVGRTPIVVFTLADGGIDALVEKLAKRGVQIVLPVSEAPGGWTSDFLDPDGHMLSFYQSNKAPR
jgi:catechol 2,3-dioxygenase-like lactoylglutathione lyase family enzyme